MSRQPEMIWEVLEIQPTRDKKAIRRAYARKCRECHPEDHPEEFRQLHQAYEWALEWADAGREPESESTTGRTDGSVLPPGSWEKLLQEKPESSDSAGDRALSPGSWEKLFQGEPETDSAGDRTIPPERWEELLARGMEESAALPPSPDSLSWQRIDRTRFSSETLTGPEELLAQMKLLETFAREHPPQEDTAWQLLMERWDQLADSRLFRQMGEAPAYFQVLFDWLNGERGRLQIPTIIGLLRIYQIQGRIIGHPWKARRYERKIPELRRLTYEYFFYQSIWNARLFVEKFEQYGDRRTKKAAAKPGRENGPQPAAEGGPQPEGRTSFRPEAASPQPAAEGGILPWLSEHRLLWKLLCVVLLLLLRLLIRIDGL